MRRGRVLLLSLEQILDINHCIIDQLANGDRDVAESYRVDL